MSAAHDAAAAQHYPQGALYVVATPIGNLADISLRALHVLQLADTLACEDTRHTQALLRAYGIDKSAAQLLAVHQHNEAQAGAQVLARLHAGQRVAYVSDAGTPGVSDPGARLVAAVQAAGLRCLPLPGASSVTSAISVAGAVGQSASDSGFVFVGFLPSKSSERARAIAQLAQQPACCVLLEAPHRIQALAQELAPLGARRVTLAREISKQFEDISQHAAQELSAWLQGAATRSKGEFVVVLHPLPSPESTGAIDPEQERVLRLLLAQLPTKSAVQLAAEITQAPRNLLYALALELKESMADND